MKNGESSKRDILQREREREREQIFSLLLLSSVVIVVSGAYFHDGRRLIINI